MTVTKTCNKTIRFIECLYLSVRVSLFHLKQVEFQAKIKLLKQKVQLRPDKWLDESEVGLKGYSNLLLKVSFHIY